MHKLIWTHILVQQTKVDAHTRKWQARSKYDHGHRVRETPTFTKEKYICFKKLPARATLAITADANAKKEYNKLQLRTIEPFRITSLQSNVFAID